MSILRVKNFQLAEMAYRLLNNAFEKFQFRFGKLKIDRKFTLDTIEFYLL